MNKILGTKSTQNPERRSGNTTRLLNEAVEDLFNGKTCYVIFSYAKPEDGEIQTHVVWCEDENNH